MDESLDGRFLIGTRGSELYEKKHKEK